MIDEKFRDEKFQYEIKRTAATISAVSSDKIDKYEHLASDEILPPQQHKTIEQAKLTLDHLRKHWKNSQEQLKYIEKHKLKH